MSSEMGKNVSGNRENMSSEMGKNGLGNGKKMHGDEKKAEKIATKLKNYFFASKHMCDCAMLVAAQVGQGANAGLHGDR